MLLFSAEQLGVRVLLLVTLHVVLKEIVRGEDKETHCASVTRSAEMAITVVMTSTWLVLFLHVSGTVIHSLSDILLIITTECSGKLIVAFFVTLRNKIIFVGCIDFWNLCYKFIASRQLPYLNLNISGSTIPLQLLGHFDDGASDAVHIFYGNGFPFGDTVHTNLFVSLYYTPGVFERFVSSTGILEMMGLFKTLVAVPLLLISIMTIRAT